MEAIVLAGGFGTRLRSMVTDVPKPMAPVNEKPFLSYLFEYLEWNGIKKIILSTGYKHDIIEEYYGKSFNNIQIVYSCESSPLGTGGAIKQALGYSSEENVFVINGDTFFNVNCNALLNFHLSKQADLTITLKFLEKFNRYGTVNLLDDKVISFHEKAYKENGLINGGVYVISSKIFNNFKLDEKFSFESEFVEEHLSKINVYGFVNDNYFIDIGIPEDYLRAQKEMGELFE